MTCLSIVREDGRTTVAANPIFMLDPMTSTLGAEVAFEVFDVDSCELKTLIGKHRFFYIDETVGVFWAQLKSLEPCVSTHPGLAQLRKKPTLGGVFVIVGDAAIRQ